MTKINRLVMHGFKSFAKRTELVFGDDFNVILGPNGSGKSNCLDALTFVLGKSSSKALRAEKSSNLIYNGGKTKKPAKQGEVSIYFDNTKKEFPTEEKEVKITRIVTGSGQSKYKINDKTRTRQQILELMNVAKIDPDGYNIILQGDIVRFVEMSGNERREIIEEISGIAVYEDKKQKAVRNLDKVEERLKEAEIILEERKKSLKELKKDRDQALKYKDMEDKIKANKATYIHLKMEKKKKEQEDVTKKTDEWKEKLENTNKKIEEMKKLVEEGKTEIENINKEIEEKGEKEQVALNKEVEELKVEYTKNTSRLDHIGSEIEKIDQREKDLKENMKEISGREVAYQKEKEKCVKEKESIEKQLAELQEKIQAFKVKNKLDSAGEIEKEISEIDKVADEKQKEIESLRAQQQECFRNKDQLEFQIENVDEKIKKVAEVEKEHKQEINALEQKRKEFKKVTLELNTLLNEDSELAAKTSDTRNKLAGAHEQLGKLRAKNASIQEGIQSSVAIQKIMEMKKPGVYGTIADLGSVASKHSMALELAAAGRIKGIVVENDKVAAECIKFLKSKRLGSATFIPLNKVRSKEEPKDFAKLAKANGVTGRAIDLIRFDAKFKKAFQYVFAGTLVVDNIEVARRIGIGVCKMVTLDGDIAETSGVMQGGFRESKKRGLGFKEDEVSKELDEYESLVMKLEADMKNIESKKGKNEEKIVNLRNVKADLEGSIIKAERSLHLDSTDLELSRKQKDDMRNELKENEEKLNKLQGEISDMNRDFAQMKVKKQQLREKMTNLRNPRLVAELNTFEERKLELTSSSARVETEIKNLETQIATILTGERENTEKIIKQLEKERTDFSDEKDALKELLKNQKSTLKEKEEQVAKFYAMFKELFNKRQKISDEVTKKETTINQKMQVSREAEIKLNTISMNNAKILAELSALEEEFTQYEGVELFKHKNEEQLRSEISRFERLKDQLGNVNMKSLEIYDEVEKEYNALLEKKEGLNTEREDVLGLIGEIEGKKKELFMKTFNVVNDHFKTFFQDLSTKGQAYLDLEEPEDPLAGGVLIKVRLSGQKFMDIKGLSGGEKTMTALAFIFAIQEHEPASFYVLDEVDAALDKHNSEKLANLVRKYTDRAQYVMISHNDGVIAKADNLYGISMDEHGMTTVTTLKV